MKRILLPVTLVLLLAAGCAKEAPSDRDIPIQLSVRLEGSTKATHEDASTIKDLDFIVRNKNNSKYSFSSTRFYPDGGRWVSDEQRLWQSNQIAVDMLALSPSVPSRVLEISDDNSSPLFSREVESVQTSGSYASDLLYTWKSNSTPNISDVSAAGFSIGLRHAMSLLKINVTLATEFNAEGVPQSCPLEYLSIDGLNGQCICRICKLCALNASDSFDSLCSNLLNVQFTFTSHTDDVRFLSVNAMFLQKLVKAICIAGF